MKFPRYNNRIYHNITQVLTLLVSVTMILKGTEVKEQTHF